MSDNKNETSDVAFAMDVLFKRKRQNTPTENTPKVRERLESCDSSTESPISKIFTRHERAEKNREKLIESRVRALSDADELRLQKIEALKEARDLKADRINSSM